MLKELLHRKKLFLFTFVTGIGCSFQFGFNVSVINSASAFVKVFINETWMERHETPLQEYAAKLIWSFIVSVLPVGGIVGTYVGGHLTTKYGRKKCMLYNNIAIILISMIMGLSRRARYFEIILVARFLYGISIGFGIMCHSLYLGESAPKDQRGAVCMSRPMLFAFGKFMGQVVGLREILGRESTWPLLLAFSGLPALIQLVTLPWFPESPRYLLIEKGNRALCQDALRRLWGSGDFTEEINDMMAERAAIDSDRAKSIREVFRDRTIRWQLISAMVISMASQLSGINVIYFYTTDVYEQLGIPKDKISYVGVGSGFIEILTSVICILFIERVGRKVLMWRGYSFMAVWMLILTVTLTLRNLSAWIPYCSLVFMFIYIFTYGLGPGCVSSVLILEIFTQSSRPAGLMISGTLQWIWLFILGLVFPFLIDTIGQLSFLVFLVSCSFAAVFVYTMIPETKGKTLLQISEEFGKMNEVNRSCGNFLNKRHVVPNTTEVFVIESSRL
uniref:Solute carrier family 2, facilitated glucose transporter member 5 n=1 Tax=Callorhinchus milii TaxID=7868 RepID=A0A4W3I0L4_CALMI|eukprot:gi/632983311/ref/XP_007908584.1/ PREDICTED: solute carrier family 2, facilitated glucose transporter member 11-like isoform X1 [Callorhinchus milii]